MSGRARGGRGDRRDKEQGVSPSALGSQYLLTGHWHHTGLFSGSSVAPRGTLYGVPRRYISVAQVPM